VCELSEVSWRGVAKPANRTEQNNNPNEKFSKTENSQHAKKNKKFSKTGICKNSRTKALHELAKRHVT